MDQDWAGRLHNWWEETERRLKKKWWTYALLLVVLFPVDLLYHRFLSYANDRLDSMGGGGMNNALAVVIGYLPATPVPLALFAAIAITLVLVVHAYFDTRPATRQSSASGFQGGHSTITRMRKAIPGGGAGYIEGYTSGSGENEFQLEGHPRRLLVDPPGEIIEESRCPKMIRIGGRTLTVKSFVPRGLVVDDHGHQIQVGAYVLDADPASQELPVTPTEEDGSLRKQYDEAIRSSSHWEGQCDLIRRQLEAERAMVASLSWKAEVYRTASPIWSLAGEFTRLLDRLTKLIESDEGKKTGEHNLGGLFKTPLSDLEPLFAGALHWRIQKWRFQEDFKELSARVPGSLNLPIRYVVVPSRLSTEQVAELLKTTVQALNNYAASLFEPSARTTTS